MEILNGGLVVSERRTDPAPAAQRRDIFTVTDVKRMGRWRSTKWLLTAPNSVKRVHLFMPIAATGEFSLTIREGTDKEGRRELTPINQDRNSPGVATLIVHRGIKRGGTTKGAVIFTGRFGATRKGWIRRYAITAGALGARTELVLRRDTKYVIQVKTYAKTHITMKLNWYESNF